MSGRVLLARNGIRVSKPGVEVTTAGLNDLLLDISAVQGQILEHGVMTLTAGSGGANYGPWNGSVSIGPYGTIPDVKLGCIFEGGRQTVPAFQRIVSGRGFRFWRIGNIDLTGSSLAVSVNGQAVSTDGINPQALVALNYIIFRRPRV